MAAQHLVIGYDLQKGDELSIHIESLLCGYGPSAASPMLFTLSTTYLPPTDLRGGKGVGTR